MPEPALKLDLGYPIVVAEDPVDLAELVAQHGPPSIVLSDENRFVRAIAAEIAGEAGVPLRAFALGESRKRLATVERALDAMLQSRVERSQLVIGVGGGIAADLFGFACASYMRGVRYAHVATSLVAMVDAAIGGKTGVNLRGGKNLAGAFRDPVAVFCEIEALDTLPYRCLREGLAEILKCGVIAGGDLFDALENISPHPFWRWPWVECIAAALEVKTSIVADDRRESG